MSDWKTMKLSEVADIIGGGTPSSFKKEYFDNGTIPWITPKDLSNYKFRYISHGERNITELGLKNSSSKLLPAGTVLLTSRAPIGYVAIAKNDICTNQGFKSLVLKSGHIPEFYYYLLKSNIPLLESRATGSTFKEISGQILKDTELNIPAFDIQQKIVDILSPIDDKIELNTQTNQTLEQIAQAIFKSWFIDFDPVKAKMSCLANGGTAQQAEREAMKIISGKTDIELDNMQQTQPEAYKTLEKTTALFPSEMVESELGMKPKGWEVTQIQNFGSIICGKTPSKKNSNFYGIDIPFIKIPDMHGNIFITKTNEYLSKEGADSQKTKYLPKGSVCISCIATVGKVSIVAEYSQTNQQINSIIPNNDYSTEFLYFYMNELKDEFYSLASGGSATLNMNTRVFSLIKLIKPKEELLSIYHSKVKSIFDMILFNQKENKNLAEIRDTLLPKLLSGEILNISDKES